MKFPQINPLQLIPTSRFLSPMRFALGVLLVALYVPTSPITARAAGQSDQTTSSGISPFGIGADYHTGRTVHALSHWIPQIQAIGIHFTRYCNSSELAYLKAHQIQSGGLLLGLPPGDTKDRPHTLPVKDLQAWSNWVTRRVTAAHGNIKYWEVWNEPPNNTGPHQTPADYAKILISAYNAAKAVDPSCKVGMAAKSVDVNYLEQAIKAGAKNHFDYITLHPYEVLGCAVNHDQDAVYMHIVPTVRKMLAAVDPAQVNVPIWFTEVGYNADPNPDIQADALVQAFTMSIAQQITCINWFEGMDGDSGPMGLLTANGIPRPAYIAMTQMIKYFGQHPVYLGWVLLADQDYGFVFQGAHTSVMSAWSPHRNINQVHFGRTVKIVNPLTGTITQARSAALGSTPILVMGVPGALVRQARADKNKPLPWDGSYARAKSVSIIMGRKITPRGLHLLPRHFLAAQVAVYGGSARSGNVPGGLDFEVDPAFLFYMNTPIEITAVVRRAVTNVPAQIILHYESPTSYEGANQQASVYNVPAGKGWHTATWKIDNDQFVSMWGYNFTLTSGQYLIKSVSVKKLLK